MFLPHHLNHILTWAPSYLEHVLGLNSAQAAQALGNYWGPSIFGLLALTVIVIKVPTRPLLLTVLVIAIVLALILQSTSDSQWFFCHLSIRLF